MKTIVVLLCMALVGGTMNTAFAQGGEREQHSPEDMATKHTAKLTEALALTSDQQKQVYNLILTKGQQKEELNNAKLTQDERQNGMKEIHASFDDKLKAVLSADQYKKYQAHKAEMKNKKHGDHKGHCHDHK